MINSAKQKGREEGEINKAKVAIKNMLEKHMAKEIIAEILEVDISLVGEVEEERSNI